MYYNDQPMDTIISSNKSYGNLYLGDYRATDPKMLKAYEIGAVISIYGRMNSNNFLKRDDISHLKIANVQNDPQFQIKKHFQVTFLFIE